MNRRGFLGSILAAAVAPAIVRADSLMRIVPRDTLFLDADMTLLPYQQEIFGRLFKLPLAAVSAMCSMDEIDTTTLFSSVKNYHAGLRYVAAEVELVLPLGYDKITGLDAEGIPLPMDAGNVTVERSVTGFNRVRIHNLDLTQFGNRVPEFQARCVKED